MTPATARRRYHLECADRTVVPGPNSDLLVYDVPFRVAHVYCLDYPGGGDELDRSRAFAAAFAELVRFVRPYHSVLLDGYDNHDYAGM
jgi:hypothetical protein